MLLKTHDGIWKRTQNEPGFECQMRELNSNSELPRAAFGQAGELRPETREGTDNGPRPEAWSNPRKVQEIYDRSQYVIENTGSALKNEPKTNSKRSLFERKMRGLGTNSWSFVAQASGQPSWSRPAPRARAEPVLSATKECPRDCGRDARTTATVRTRHGVPRREDRSGNLICSGGAHAYGRSEWQNGEKHKIVGTKLRSC